MCMGLFFNFLLGVGDMAFITTKPIIMIGGSCSITNINFDMFIDKNNIAQVISGGARGIDKLAEDWAKRNKIDFQAYLAQWDKFGKCAGVLRNKDMIEAADICYFFWDGKSPGTKQAIEYAKSIGREYYVHLFVESD